MLTIGKHRADIEILRDEFNKYKREEDKRFKRLLNWMVRTDGVMSKVADKLDKGMVWEK